MEQIRQSEEEYIDNLQQIVNESAKIDGKLALEILARKRPKEFGKKDKLDLKGDIKTTSETTVKLDESDERVDAVIEILKTAKGIEEAAAKRSGKTEA